MVKLTAKTGEELTLSLDFAKVRKVSHVNPDIVNKYMTAIDGKAKNQIEMFDMIADVLYLAYLCSHTDNLDNVMDQESFVDILPDDINTDANAMFGLINPNQNGDSVRRSSNKRKS